MTESTQELVTLDDFDAICRVCLQSHDDMIDIFGSGMDNQLMEITKLKVRSDDKLPKALCQSCRDQMDYFAEFQKKAKCSDKLLRSLLLNNGKSEMNEEGSFISNLKTSKAKSHKRKARVLEGKVKQEKKRCKDRSHNKMYLIVVPNADEDDASDVKNEICIKDLNVGNDNPELTYYCKNLVKNYFVDHSYPKVCNKISNYLSNIGAVDTANTQGDESVQTESNLKSAANTDVMHKVNLCIFQCKECQESFDESYDLSSHYLISHNIEEPYAQHFSYNCPACDFYDVRREHFLEHLLKHKKNGYQFVKVDSEGKSVPVKESEKNLFYSLSLERSAKENFNIFKLGIDLLKCSVCIEKVEYGQISEHIKLCHENENVSYYEKYVCPVCCTSFVNEKDQFMEHLKSHVNNNVHFIKVNSDDEPIEINVDKGNSEVFLPYEEAINIIKVVNGSHKVFPITDIYSCNKCEYSGESFRSVSDHYFQEHSEVYTLEPSVFCPVCHEEFQVPDLKAALYDHLEIHKNEVFFVEVSKTGSINNIVKDHSDIFRQSNVLYGLSVGSLTAGVNQIWYPELVVFCTKGIAHEAETDSCDKLIDNDYPSLKSLFSDGGEGVKNDLNIVCEKCGKTFAEKLKYKKHCATHLKNDLESLPKGKRPVCSICRKTFANRNSLTCHMRNHMEEGSGNSELESFLAKIICEECGKSFSNHTSLTKHKRVHKTEKENVRLKCGICNREFVRQSSFDRHMAAHLNPKYFDCDMCKLPLSSMASLQKHAELHKTSSNTFDCKSCKTSFLTKDSLTAHQTHTGHYQDRKPLECNVCHEKFYIGRKFTEHIKKHPKYKMGECTLCGKKLSTVQSLMLHMGRHFESNSILCPHCGKQFFEERNYHRHLLTHEGIKPFACDVEGCEKSFYTLFELNRHKKYHNNTRDFVCPYCGKSFHEANHLTVHVRTHTGERPYICPHCNKGFITRTRCKHHIKLVHQGIGYDLIQSTISKKVTVFEAVEAII